VQAVAPVVQTVAPVAAQAITAVVPAPVAAAVAPVAAPVAAVVSSVTTPAAAVVAPVTAPLEPLVSAVVAPLTPAISQVVEPLAPVVAPVVPAVLEPLSPVLGPLGDAVVAPVFGAADADVAAALGVAVSVPETDATTNATASGGYLRLAPNGASAASAGPQTTLGSAAASAPDGAPGLPADGPLPASPTALSGSAASSAAGGSSSSADVARGFSLAAARGASVITLDDDDLPSSPTFPSDTTPD